MRKLLLSLFLTSVVLLQGCATSASIKEIKEQGEKRIYNVAYEKVWQGALFACNLHSLYVEETDKEKGYIGAITKTRWKSWGEVIGIWISKKENNSVEVSVVSRFVGPSFMSDINWERPVLEGIDAYLKLNP